MTNYILVTDGSISERGVATGGFGYRFSKIEPDGSKTLIIEGGGQEESTTNNRMEITAIRDGLFKVKNYFIENGLKPDDNIIIISDSDLCVKTLTDYVFKWIKKMVDGILYNSTKKPVINQDVILDAFESICLLRRFSKVYVYHINSHLSKKNRQLDKEKFAKKNNCLITDELFNSIVEENEAVDDLAYSYMKGIIK